MAHSAIGDVMAQQRVNVKKVDAAARRQEFQKQQRRRALIRRAVFGVVLLSAAAGTGYCVITDRQFQAGVVTATYPAAQHLPGSLTYRETPPLGGAHNVAWQNCGIYTVPIHQEHAVHSLEHGAVWITYRPDLPAADVQRLQTLASDDYMLLSPYPGLPAPVVASAWNNQMQMTGVDDPRLPQFIRRFKNNPGTTPEFGASCLGGISTTADVNTLNNGGGPMMR
jgi:hypothetical protein